MKLDEKYFEGKMYVIESCKSSNEIIPVLKRIAVDFFEAGAEAQKEKCLEILEIVDMHTWYGDSGYTIAANMRVAIINTATVKWEVPGE